MNIQSPKVNTQKSTVELFNFLTDVVNYEKLMPENISKFEIIRENAFVFALKGMPEIALELKNSTPNSKVVLGSMSDKLSFTLSADIEETSSGKAATQLTFEGEFNMMMTMMIKGPITKFLETLAENVSKL